MIRVTVQIVPFGLEGAAETLGVVSIVNVRTLRSSRGEAGIGHYNVELAPGLDQPPVAKTKVKHFDRNLGWLPLVFMAIQALAQGWKQRSAKGRYGWTVRFARKGIE